MSVDVASQLKAGARLTWSRGAYGEIARNLVEMSAHLVRAARVESSDRVLDVACGTGISSITARHAGAGVVGLDLTPSLLDEAREQAEAAGVRGIEWREGDAEALPFGDGEFDVVLSSFGHMFAPRPEAAIGEMLRVLRPGGRIAFTTWPPEHAIGGMFKAIARHVPPPTGVPSPLEWGMPDVVARRLGNRVEGLVFERGVIRYYALSPTHHWHIFSTWYGPTIRAIEAVGSEGTEALMRDYVAAVLPYWRDNAIHKDYLLTRAVRV